MFTHVNRLCLLLNYYLQLNSTKQTMSGNIEYWENENIWDALCNQIEDCQFVGQWWSTPLVLIKSSS